MGTVIGPIVGSLLSAALKELREFIVRQPGIRRLQLEHGRELPDEEPLNLHVLGEAFARLLATAFGLLASVWATVVLLGGFATILDKLDFWFATIIVFIETFRIIGFNPQPEAKFFNEAPQAVIELYFKPLQKTDSTGATAGRNYFFRLAMGFITSTADFTENLALGALLIAVAPVVAGSTCAALSIVRLFSITGQDYAGASKDSSKANVKPALIFFYSLVLTQVLFLIVCYQLNWLPRSRIIESLRKKCGFKEEEEQLIQKYIDNTLDTCIEAGVAKTIKRNLVSFAQDLLKNESDDGHVTAVHVLHALMEQDAHRARTISQIKSSDQCVSRLFGMLSSKSLVDHKTKAYTAAVAARLAGNMQLSDIPGATQSILFMLGSPSSKSATQDVQGANQEPGATTTPESKTLIAHALLILSGFACNPENCRRIYNTKGLVSKIIALLRNGVRLVQHSRTQSIEIIKESLSVLAKLVLARGNNLGLRKRILGDASCIKEMLPRTIGEQDSQIALIEIIASLAQDEATRGNFLHMSDFVTELLLLCFGQNNTQRDEILKKLPKLFLTGANGEETAAAAAAVAPVSPAEGAAAAAAPAVATATAVAPVAAAPTVLTVEAAAAAAAPAAPAAAALIALARGSADCMMIMREDAGGGETVIQRLPTMLRPDADVKFRTAITLVLAHFCANSLIIDTEEQRNTLEPLRQVFGSVLQPIVGAEAQPPQSHVLLVNIGANHAAGRAAPQNEPPWTELLSFFNTLWRTLVTRDIFLSAKNFLLTKIIGKENQPNQMEVMEPAERKLLVASLVLASEMITKNLLPNASNPIIPVDPATFVQKLKEILERNKEPTPDCLDIIRATTNLSISVMRQQNLMVTAEHFQRERFGEALNEAAERMRELEDCMLLTGSVSDVYRTLPSLVQEANGLIGPAVTPPS